MFVVPTKQSKDHFVLHLLLLPPHVFFEYLVPVYSIDIDHLYAIIYFSFVTFSMVPCCSFDYDL